MKNLMVSKKLLAIFTISVLASFAFPMVLAASSAPAPVIPAQCTTPSMGGIASGWVASPIVNAKMTVKNDEDAGNAGYWALDHYVKSFIIWENVDSTPNTFCAEVQYKGTWTTFAGALSPAFGVVQPANGHGTMTEAYVALFTGTFLGNYCKTTRHITCVGNYSRAPLIGNIGTFNYGGTQADILLPYSAQQGPTTYTSIYNLYFSGHAGFTYLAQSSIYIQGSGMGYGNLFVSSAITAAASIGDIIT